MSKFNYGLRKTYSSASQAFRDADYAEAITRPQNRLEGTIWAVLIAITIALIFGYGFWLTISI